MKKCIHPVCMLLLTLLATPRAVLSQASINNQSSINSVLYVGAGITNWGSGDIGSQVNAAYAALPATGGTIYGIPQANGACYSFSTTINFNTSNKPVSFRGLAPSNSSITISGFCINYTPTVSGTAINVDWSPLAPTAFQSSIALADMTIVNANCTTNGGCGYGTIGVNMGATNGGAFGARFSNVNVFGFGNGYRNSAGAAWGRQWDGGSIAFNTIGVEYLKGNESDTYVGVKIIDNSYGIEQANSPSEVNLIGGSVDSNATPNPPTDSSSGCGINQAAGTYLYASNVHWENNAVKNAKYVCGVSGSVLTLVGGSITDGGSGLPSQNFFTFGSGAIDSVQLLASRAETGLIFNALDQASVTGISVPSTVNFPDSVICAVGSRCSLSYTSPQQKTGVTYTNVLNQSGGTNSFAGISACVSNAVTVTLPHTYNHNPIVVISDDTTTGGARITGRNNSQFAVSCTGASDAFDWIAIGNPN